jgi:predicted RNA-binding protein with TRAM domain
MVQLPDRLECLFSASVEQRGDSYSIEVPRSELERGEISSTETYRVAVLPRTPQNRDTDTHQREDSVSTAESIPTASQTPPVSEGDVREVTIETIGDRGDGIAKVERGYVVIVPGTRPDDEVTIEITNARENVAFAQVRDVENTSDDSAGPDESFADETLGE